MADFDKIKKDDSEQKVVKTTVVKRLHESTGILQNIVHSNSTNGKNGRTDNTSNKKNK